LDEWTLQQVDAMHLGGNANATQYFCKHGLKIHQQGGHELSNGAVQNGGCRSSQMSETNCAADSTGSNSANGTYLLDALEQLDQKNDMTDGSTTAIVVPQWQVQNWIKNDYFEFMAALARCETGSHHCTLATYPQ
jgi:hypothetical protein